MTSKASPGQSVDKVVGAVLDAVVGRQVDYFEVFRYVVAAQQQRVDSQTVQAPASGRDTTVSVKPAIELQGRYKLHKPTASTVSLRARAARKAGSCCVQPVPTRLCRPQATSHGATTTCRFTNRSSTSIWPRYDSLCQACNRAIQSLCQKADIRQIISCQNNV